MRIPVARSSTYRLLREAVCAVFRRLYHACIKGRFPDRFVRGAYHWLWVQTRRVLEWRDALHERRMGVSTVGIKHFEDMSQNKDSVHYEPTDYDLIPPLLDYLELQPDDVFVDLGCGKGRVLVVAARYPIRKVIGLELVPEIAEAARENMQRLTTQAPVEILQGDAVDFDPREGTVFYFYHPFGERTLTTVLNNMRQSIERNPRTIRIVYNSPPLAGIPVNNYLDTLEWLTPETSLLERIRIWRSTCKVPAMVEELSEP
ncbi:MAG: SAM-dependent methyltransferase [Armatimonadota bacterium]